MTNHRVVVQGGDGALRGKCSCRQQGPVTSSRQEAEDWGVLHLRMVERAKASARRSQPSLKDEAAWYRKQAEDHTNPTEVRELWTRMAEEIERRISTAQGEQGSLF